LLVTGISSGCGLNLRRSPRIPALHSSSSRSRLTKSRPDATESQPSVSHHSFLAGSVAKLLLTVHDGSGC
jgi:hypothetical protein